MTEGKTGFWGYHAVCVCVCVCEQQAGVAVDFYSGRPEFESQL